MRKKKKLKSLQIYKGGVKPIPFGDTHIDIGSKYCVALKDIETNRFFLGLI